MLASSSAAASLGSDDSIRVIAARRGRASAARARALVMNSDIDTGGAGGVAVELGGVAVNSNSGSSSDWGRRAPRGGASDRARGTQPQSPPELLYSLRPSKSADRTAATEGMHELDDAGTKRDDEERREQAEDEREDQLDTNLCGALFGPLP